MGKLKLVFTVLMVFAMLTGCSAKSSFTSSDNGVSTPPEMGEMSSNGAQTNDTLGTPEMKTAEHADIANMERKLVMNGNFELETLEFDKSIADFEKMVADCGGYIQSNSTSGQGAVNNGYIAPKWASYTVKIPADKLNSFTDVLAKVGSITNSSMSVDDITDNYYDVQARIVSLQAQEKSLLDILAKADKLSDVVSLQTALSDVRFQIESNQGIMRRMDNQVQYSTLDVSLRQVYELGENMGVPTTMWERISQEFHLSMRSIKTGLEDFVVIVVGNIVYIAVFAVIGFFVVKYVKKYFKNRKKPDGK